MKFGDRVMNTCASPENPHKYGYFVRRGYTSGLVNRGPYIEVTDGKGDFWKTDPEFISPTPESKES